MTGTNIAFLESLGVAGAIPAADTLIQGLASCHTSGCFQAIDWQQVAVAGALGALAYLVGFLRGLPLAPNGKPLEVADVPPHG